MYRSLVIIVLLLVCGSSLIARGQATPVAPDQTPATTIRTTVHEVVLDMVFRDKKGKTIRDIRPEEVHISEDGVDQKVTGFRLVDGKNAQALSSGSTTGAPLPLDP